ncbi:MAG: hypothetical protein N2747_09135 [Chitinophagaceae bacterium]|nr:hypothetical protein [Chitinophagaceae bacterium]
MKRTLLFIFSLLSLSVSAKAQKNFSMGYSLSFPMGGMAGKFNAIHSITTDFSFRPKKNLPLRLGGELFIGTYASMSHPIQLSFNNSTPVSTNIYYNSNVARLAATVEWEWISKEHFSLYSNAKAGGMSFFSNLTIEDPDDPTACRALESRAIQRDFGFAGGGGLGMRFLVNPKSRLKNKFLDVGVNYLHGTRVDYINTKHLHHHDHAGSGSQPGSGSGNDPKARPLTARFLHVQSNTVHMHKLAEIYNDPIRLLNIQVKYVLRF